MKNIILSLLATIWAIVMLTGCADKGGTKFETELGGLEYESADMGRFSAWAKAESARITALKALGAPKTPKDVREQVVVNLDTPEKILQWTLYKTTEAMGEAMKDMANGRKVEAVAASLKQAPMPKGAVAEGFDSFGGVIREAGHTPATVIGMTAQAIKFAASGSGDKTTTTINGNENKVDQSKNTSHVIADRENVATGAPTGPQQTTVVEAAPEPTEEEVVEEGGEVAE